MINYLIVGIASAGIELIYQKLMFKGNPLYWWFQILKHWRWNDGIYPFRSQIAKILGYCHFCNSVWLSFIIHSIVFKIDFYMFITAGISYVVLCMLLPIKWLINTEN